VTRRAGIAAVVLGALLTVLFGGWLAAVGLSWILDDGLWTGERLWRSIFVGAGTAAVASGAYCVFLAAPGLVRGTLSARAERWTWVATAAFAVLSFATFVFFPLGVIGPIATLVALRLARGPRPGARAMHVGGGGP
jgi:hypothetical protein